MPISIQVLAEIDRDEPNYATLAKLGGEALPHLQLIIDADDPLRASKAAYAVALIGGAGSAEALQKAAEHQDPQVRIAVAYAMRNSTSASRIKMLDRLLDDQDAGVRKVALSAVGDMPAELRRRWPPWPRTIPGISGCRREGHGNEPKTKPAQVAEWSKKLEARNHTGGFRS
jgi:hypothetical protein